MNFLTKFDRWEPFDELAALRNRMDRLWSLVGSEDEPMMATWSPVSDVIETKDEIVVKAELAGIDAKDVDVEIENGMLTIRGERKAEQKTEEKGYRRSERSYGTFYRKFTLPPNVEQEKISAAFNDGLLEVHMPKKETAKPRTVKVEVKKQLSPAA